MDFHWCIKNKSIHIYPQTGKKKANYPIEKEGKNKKWIGTSQEKKAHKIHKNMLNLINNERNSNENHNKVPFQTNHISKNAES